MILLNLLVFGFLVTSILGLTASWVDRKVTARVQYRVGPPFYQPLVDIIKLLGKETLVPTGSNRSVFLGAPLLGLAGAVTAATVLWMNQIHPQTGFTGDWIVVIYLLTIPSMSIIIGGFASRNPLASLGASREMKLVLSYELPFILAMLVPVVHSGLSIRLGDILLAQREAGAFAGNLSGILAMLVGLLCIQAKLALVPFDAPEAETEIVHGPLIEYSGTGLAMYKLTKNMMLFILPFFLIQMFLGGFSLAGWGILWSVLKFVGVLALITVIRNTNPRVRIDQAMRFFWGPMTVIAAVSLILALLGL